MGVRDLPPGFAKQRWVSKTSLEDFWGAPQSLPRFRYRLEFWVSATSGLGVQDFWTPTYQDFWTPTYGPFGSVGHPITIPTGEVVGKVCRRQTTEGSPRPSEGEVRRRRTEARSVAGGHAGPAKPEARPAIDNQSAMRPTSGRAAERVGINSGHPYGPPSAIRDTQSNSGHPMFECATVA